MNRLPRQDGRDEEEKIPWAQYRLLRSNAIPLMCPKGEWSAQPGECPLAFLVPRIERFVEQCVPVGAFLKAQKGGSGPRVST